MIEEKLYSAFRAATLTQGLVLLIEIKKNLKIIVAFLRSHLQGVPIVWKP